MQQIVILVGKTCTGKTTLAKHLEKSAGFDRIRTATTRPMRDGEPPYAYYFFTRNNFDHYQYEEAFLEVDEVNGFKYGSFYRDYLFDDTNDHLNKVVILTPEGVYNAVEQIDKDSLLIIWVDPPEEDVLKHAVARGDSISWVRKRLEEEGEIFERFEHSALADMVFYKNESIEEMADWIIKVCDERDVAFGRK